jgi:hypothetical protein
VETRRDGAKCAECGDVIGDDEQVWGMQCEHGHITYAHPRCLSPELNEFLHTQRRRAAAACLN